jgi:hypothetical protein
MPKQIIVHNKVKEEPEWMESETAHMKGMRAREKHIQILVLYS